jgi:hypothetical protein
MRVLKPCGTRAAHDRHIARGEDPCPPCRAANARSDAASRAILTAALLPVERVAAGPPPISPLVVLYAAGRWAAVCTSEACGSPHVVHAGGTIRAAEQAADHHLKALTTPVRDVVGVAA